MPPGTDRWMSSKPGQHSVSQCSYSVVLFPYCIIYTVVYGGEGGHQIHPNPTNTIPARKTPPFVNAPPPPAAPKGCFPAVSPIIAQLCFLSLSSGVSIFSCSSEQMLPQSLRLGLCLLLVFSWRCFCAVATRERSPIDRFHLIRFLFTLPVNNKQTPAFSSQDIS